MGTKRSLWNLDSSTYDGRHSRMDAAAIRGAIAATIRPTPRAH